MFLECITSMLATWGEEKHLQFCFFWITGWRNFLCLQSWSASNSGVNQKQLVLLSYRICPCYRDPLVWDQTFETVFQFSIKRNWISFEIVQLYSRPKWFGTFGLQKFREMPLEILKSHPVSFLRRSPENDILSRRETFLNSTLSLSFFRKNCALPWKVARKPSEIVEMIPSKRFKTYSQSADGLQWRFSGKDHILPKVDFRLCFLCSKEKFCALIDVDSSLVPLFFK